jgi:SPP1 gp7 family putative phage head morphogenesis protein
MPTHELEPIKIRTADFDPIEDVIKAVLFELIYRPIIEGLDTKLKNAKDTLLSALRSGRVTYFKGRFSGRFGGQISKELLARGAKWDKRTFSYVLPYSELPMIIKDAIASGSMKFKEKLAAIDKKLEKLLPAEIAAQASLSKHFDSTIWKVDRDVLKSMEHLLISPALSAEARKQLADEWQHNARLSIEGLATEQISKLRSDIQASITAGNRYQSLVKIIQASHGVSMNKAKFIARQETSLLMTKLKEMRYTSSGVDSYRWVCVAGSKAHQVRPSHKVLDGKIFRWDDPPQTSSQNEPIRHNNPGQDFNCRCAATPIIHFRRTAGGKTAKQ